MRRLLLILALALAACSSSPAPDARQWFVIDGHKVPDETLSFLLVAPCTQAPSTSSTETYVSDIHDYCDWSALKAVPTDIATWNAYNAGDPYPKPIPSASPASS